MSEHKLRSCGKGVDVSGTGSDISLDQDEAAIVAAKWREYADQVESHGKAQHVPPETLRALLGDVYSDYISAKQAEYEARNGAYQRVAAQARAHADKLDNTRSSLSEGDGQAAATFRALID